MMRKPDWIRYRIPGGGGYIRVKKTVSSLGLHTVCTEAQCPNAGECFACGTAAFLILGDTCTRDCRYCAVKKGIPVPPDPGEPEHVAEAVKNLKLEYAVVTSVTRDDLADGGASFFAATCTGIKKISPGCGVELLVPDFMNSMEQSADIIAESRPDVFNHNMETVRDCFPLLRPSGSYEHSLRLLKYAARLGMKTKSGIMVGFGETADQVRAVMNDLAEAGCTMLTIGQYLSPGKKNFQVAKYYDLCEFEEIRETAESIGFSSVMSGPLVRSSYHASEMKPGD